MNTPRWPDYRGRGLSNVPAAVCEILGVPSDGMLPPLDHDVLPPEFRSGIELVIVLLADGLGAAQLKRAMDAGDAPVIAQAEASAHAKLSRLTSVFPSSTVPGLAALATGTPPAAHGLMGWITQIPEAGGPTEIVRWGPAQRAGSWINPESGTVPHLPVPTVHERLAAAGVQSHAVCPGVYEGSPFTQQLYGGAAFHPYQNPSDSWKTVLEIVAKRPAGQRTVIYAYHPSVDYTAHHHGPTSPEHRRAIQDVNHVLGKILDGLPKSNNALLLLTADHGHVEMDLHQMIDLADHPAILKDLVLPPTGERRVVYLHVRPGRVPFVMDYIKKHLGEAAEVHPASYLLEKGLFGPVSAGSPAEHRTGDLVLIAKGAHQLITTGANLLPTEPHHGDHGGLEPSEMEIPLLAVRV
jgi:hypothetical protein